MDGTLSGGRYDALCREITAEMSARSLEAIAVEDALLAAGKEAPAASIRVVQMGEKAKLNLTCTLQVLRKSAAEGRWRWQRGDDDEEASPLSPPPPPPRRRSHPRRPRGHLPPGVRQRQLPTEVRDAPFGCGCPRGWRIGAPEPTEAEYAGAVAEATRRSRRRWWG